MRIILVVFSDDQQELLTGTHIRDLHVEEDDSVAIAWGQSIVQSVWPSGAVRAEILEVTTPMMVEIEQGFVKISADGTARKLDELRRAP